jgi:hypothetical protein
VEEDQIHVFLSEQVAGCDCLFRSINQARIHHPCAQRFESAADGLVARLQTFTQTGELLPVRFQPNAEQANSVILIYGVKRSNVIHGRETIDPRPSPQEEDKMT